MNRESENQLDRLRDETGSLDAELLRSALHDRPRSGVANAALGQVIEQRRRERSGQRKRLLALAGGAVVLAAGLLLWLPTPSATIRVAAESSSGPRRKPAPPAPSASPTPSPFAACSPAIVASGKEPLVDDFEDGDVRIPPLDQRAGPWIAYNDGTAQQTPRPGSEFLADRIPGGRDKSRFGLHSRGGKFSKWGAAVAIEFTPRRCYDASVYAGVTFWARGHAKLRVNVKMTQVVAPEYGGSCEKDCFDSHGALRQLSRDWKRYELRWEDLAQSGFGTPLQFDPHSVYSLEFATGADQPPYDFWIDDVAFLQR